MAFGNKNHRINHSYFEDIDTEEKAYFYGLLLADGCIVEPKPRALPSGNICHPMRILQLGLHREDEYMVECFQTAVGASHLTIHRMKRQPLSSLSIASNQMTSDLIRHGLGPRKSLREKAPGILPSQLFRHFAAGIIDGDGSLYFRAPNGTNRKEQPRFGFIGSREICEYIRNGLIEDLGVEVNLSSKHAQYQTLNKAGWAVVDLARYLYEDQPLRLRRKAAVAQRMFEWAEERGGKKWNFKEINPDFCRKQSIRAKERWESGGREDFGL